MDQQSFSGYEFRNVFINPYASLYYNEQLKLVICVADVDYIPIANFKEIFLTISELIEEYPITSLIFDKRKLRTFHQPSMEWYFAIWKPGVKTKGLINHYKILPPLQWFVQAVNAGKFEIFNKFSKDILSGISITYTESVENAIVHLLNASGEAQPSTNFDTIL